MDKDNNQGNMALGCLIVAVGMFLCVTVGGFIEKYRLSIMAIVAILFIVAIIIVGLISKFKSK